MVVFIATGPLTKIFAPTNHHFKKNCSYSALKSIICDLTYDMSNKNIFFASLNQTKCVMTSVSK